MEGKVLFVASPWLGGSGTVAFRLAEAISARGIETHFISYEKPFKSTKESNIHFHIVKGYEYSLFPSQLYELALAEEIVKVVIEHDISVINVHYGILFGHAVQLAKNILATYNRKIKVVLTLHGSDVVGFDFENPGTIVPKHLNNWIIDTADELVVASKSLREMIWRVNGNFRETKIIPNFVDHTIYAPGKLIRLNKIVHISNFRKVKQPFKVLEVFMQIKKVVEDAKLVLVGEGPLKTEAEKFIVDREIRDVEFLGKIDHEEQIAEILSDAKVLLLPSLFENFPLVAIEALACGVPVIASDRGGIPEIIKNDETGYVFPLEQVQKMAEKAIEILNTPPLFDKLSDRAIEFSKKYSLDSVVDQYLLIFSPQSKLV